MLAAVLLPAGVLIIIVLVTAVVCVACKRSKKKKKEEDVTKTDENHYYGIYYRFDYNSVRFVFILYFIFYMKTTTTAFTTGLITI